MKTVADKISERFGNDTFRWRDDDGKHLADALADAGAKEERLGRISRFVFSDRSAIVVTPCGWYRSYSDCLCAASLGHSDRCPYGGTSQ